MLKKYGHENRVREFNLLSAEHVKSQAPQQGFVVGSVGPTGEFLDPLGNVSELEMKDAFAEQITALSEGGADAILIETMYSIEESSLAIKAAKENTELTIMATMTFDKGPRGFFTMMGTTPRQAGEDLVKSGAVIVGANCGNGIEIMSELAKRFRECGEGYVWINSNAGIPEIRQGQIIYPETPDYMSEGFSKLIDMGINIVGGCCGTTPDHIKRIASLISEKKGN